MGRAGLAGSLRCAAGIIVTCVLAAAAQSSTTPASDVSTTRLPITTTFTVVLGNGTNGTNTTTAAPTNAPTNATTAAPTNATTNAPTNAPTNATTLAPTAVTEAPTPQPTAHGHAHNSTGPPEVGGGYMTYVGAVISIIGNLCISGGLNVQKFVHMKIAEAEDGAHDGVVSTDYTKHRVWWGGMVLMALGEMGNFGAYFFAPASLVAPLGTVTVVANAIIAPVCLGIGVLASVSGAVLIVVGAPDTEDALDTELLYKHLVRPVFLSYAISIIFISIGCYVGLRKGYGERYIIIPLFITATLGSFTILSVKSLSMLLRETFAGNNQFKAPLIYFVIFILVGTAVTQVRFLNYAMGHFDSTEVVPTFFVMFTIAAIMIGAIFFEDFDGVGEIKRIIFASGILCCFFGVYLITSCRPKDERESPTVAFSARRGESGSVSFNKPNDSEDDGRGDQSYLLLPEEVYGRDRSDSGHSLSSLNPLLGVETTPLMRTRMRERKRRSRLTVNGSSPPTSTTSQHSPLAPPPVSPITPGNIMGEPARPSRGITSPLLNLQDDESQS